MSGEDEWQNGRGAVDPSWQHFKTRQFAERKGLKDSFGGFVLCLPLDETAAIANAIHKKTESSGENLDVIPEEHFGGRVVTEEVEHEPGSGSVDGESQILGGLKDTIGGFDSGTGGGSVLCFPVDETAAIANAIDTNTESRP
ncbi:hypothetical protein SUGI_0385340 [Cryptomeria japonica]|nr:hypothetical protein SUGI_0385340 [Cryptomeria japonica]